MGWSSEFTFGELPLKRLECGPLHWVSNNQSIVKEDKSVSRGESENGLPWAVRDFDELFGV